MTITSSTMENLWKNRATAVAAFLICVGAMLIIVLTSHLKQAEAMPARKGVLQKKLTADELR
jgi:hypothetical protein